MLNVELAALLHNQQDVARSATWKFSDDSFRPPGRLQYRRLFCFKKFTTHHVIYPHETHKTGADRHGLSRVDAGTLIGIFIVVVQRCILDAEDVSCEDEQPIQRRHSAQYDV